jgi:outer membrane protein assembly factor BamD
MRSAYILPVILLTIISCATRQTLTPLEPAAEYERALSFFENKKYDQAIQGFERILFYHPSSEFVDDAQYWLGRTYLEQKEYDQAIIEFDYLIRNFPKSAQLEDAYFHRARAHLLAAPSYEKDLSDLKIAIRFFDEFLTRYPNSKHTDDVRKEILTARERLAKKQLENGKLYEKLKEMTAALLYYEHITNNYPETVSAGEARFRSAHIYEKRGENEKALELYRKLLDNAQWQDKAADRITDLEKTTN